MTKLEEKLIELGYIRHIVNQKLFYKYLVNDFCINLLTNKTFNKIEKHNIEVFIKIETYKDLILLQESYFEMQKDLEVLKQCQ